MNDDVCWYRLGCGKPAQFQYRSPNGKAVSACGDHAGIYVHAGFERVQ